MSNKQSFSFNRGYQQLPASKLKEARMRIMEALGLATDPSFYRRLRGNSEPKVSEARAIEAIFAEYGITDIWGS